MVDYLQKGQTINVSYYASHIRQLRENIKVKCIGKLSTGVLFTRTMLQLTSLSLLCHCYGCHQKVISGTHFQSDNDIIHAVENFLDSQEKDFF